MPLPRALRIAGWCLLLPWLPLHASSVLAAKGEFEAQVASILEQRCVRCHNAEVRKGNLSLASRELALAGGDSGEVIVAGSPDESLLLDMVSGDSPEMPKQGPPLKPAEVAALKHWIADGAKWPDGRVLTEKAPQHLDWWSLQPVSRPELPRVKNTGWVRNPIDRFVLAQLEQAGLAPNPAADRRTLLRRLSLDLWGLMPSTEQVIAFEQSQSPDAYQRLVDSHLSSIHFGERYAAYWLDTVRFAETNGFETNVERPNAWHYRDYVIQAFTEDRPYDRFVLDQVAGDIVGADVATGFLVAGTFDQVKSPDPVLTANQRADELHDIVSTTSSTFLGLTVGCARCHDHKFDPIPQHDYYALKAVFEGVQHGERPLQSEMTPERKKKLSEVQLELAAIDQRLGRLQPQAKAKRVIALHHDDPRTKQLIKTQSAAPYGTGKTRGETAFRGDGRHLPTIGKGFLSWSRAVERDVLAWSPAVDGTFRVWVSWGVLPGVHATDAHYVLDRDGDLATTVDQQVIGICNQQQFADGTDETASRSAWSGLKELGNYEFTAVTTLLLRTGKSTLPVSADVLVLEEVNSAQREAMTPHLRAPVNAGENVERFAPTPARFVRFTVLDTSQFEPCIDELEVFSADTGDNIALAATGAKPTSSGDYPDRSLHRLENVNDGQYGNGRSWISSENGQGWVQIELPDQVQIDRIAWSRDRSVPRVYEDRLATKYRIEVSLDGQQWTRVASSDDRLPRGTPLPGGLIIDPIAAADEQISSDDVTSMIAQRAELGRQVSELFKVPTAYCGQMTAPIATHRFHRGDPMQPREEVAAGALSAINVSYDPSSVAADLPETSRITDEARRRLALGQWIVDRNNPLTARVIVNRIWQWHFGEGLVSTPSDFGVNGGKPTHPELLDWLASELMDHGWSLHHIHRLILTSATYQQASTPNESGTSKDSSSLLLWRYPPRRLEAEPLRDAMLAVAGTLDLTTGGPSVSPFQTNENYVRVYLPKTEFTAADYRRMVYQRRIRMQVDPTFGVFDCPDGGQVAPKRGRSITPLQALNLLNSPFVLEQAKAFADRLEKEAPADVTTQVRRAFSLAFQRQPSDAELSECTAVIEKHGLVVLCRALLNSNEFAYLE